jgi:hypothetical protein
MAGMICWEEKQAQYERSQLIFNSAESNDIQASNLASDSKLSVSPTELAELKARVTYLSHRQMAREDLTEVQEILLPKLGSQVSMAAELQSFHWQNGALEFEAFVESPQNWHSLMQDLQQFDRWKSAPQILQTHRVAGKVPGNVPVQVAFKLKAKLWTHSSPDSNSSSTITNKSAP